VKPVHIAVSCLIFCSPVLAQTEKAMEDKAPSAPVDIRSDHLTVHQKEHRAVFTGNVRTVQGDLEIRCEKLTVTYSGEKDGGSKAAAAKAGEIKQMLFSGSVSIVQKKRRGHCNRAVYDRVAGRIVCTGKPWVVEGENRIRGERIVYLLEEDEIRVTRPQAVIRLKEDGKKKGGLRK
jgi:lipopolysaccharide transport protein LptA